MGKLYTGMMAVIVGSGGLLFGYDQGIISSTLAQTEFIAKFGATPSEEGGIVSSFSGGAFFGAILAGYLADKIGRKRSLMIGAIIAIAGCAIQTAAVNVAMLIVGRLIAGVALGILTMIVPMYNSEIAAPSNRGMLSGLLQQMLSFGYVISYGASFLTGEKQWRLGLGLQLVWAGLFLVGLFFVPYSPRWLAGKGRHEEGRAVLHKLHFNGSNEEWLEAEYAEIARTTEWEKANKSSNIMDLVKTPAMRKRTATALGIQFMTQMTGINVINYFGPALYATLGFSDQDTLLINGLYGIIGPIVCAVALLFLVDRFGRKPLLLVGTVICCIAMATEAAIQNYYPADSTNYAAHRAGVAMIAIFSVGFSFSYGPISWIYASEVFPNRIRHIGVAASTCSSWAANVLFGQTGSLGINNLGWSYYLAFVVFNIFNFVVILLFFPETKRVSLEAIAKLFGDDELSHDPAVDAGNKVEDGKAGEGYIDNSAGYNKA